jgi:branched-subunit amino acid aminotransferase/4-amino-4-deoxychorismate lyase
MIVYIDGKFLPETEAKVSVLDRSFMYGDGVFETMLLFNFSIFRWREHIDRLLQGARFLRINTQINFNDLYKSAIELAKRNNMPKGLLRLQLTRGVGLRGYSTRGANQPSLIMTIHPMPVVDFNEPPEWTAIQSNYLIPAGNPLFNYKSCNKLINILAKQEADVFQVDEAILVNTDGEVCSCSGANIFYVKAGYVLTPPIECGALPGITRQTVFELCRKLGIHFGENIIRPQELLDTDGVFLTLTSWGIVNLTSINGKTIFKSEIAEILHKNYWQLVMEETENISHLEQDIRPTGAS